MKVPNVVVALISLVLFSSTSHPAVPQGAAGAAYIWKDPGVVEKRDTFYAAGWEGGQPVEPFTFVNENLKGTTSKVVVTDRNGVSWDVKLGPEAHAEVAANRLFWAVGYLTQEMYYLPTGVIAGIHGLQRASKHIDAKGRFAEARFRKRDPSIDDGPGGWAFSQNPFVGTKELSGLILMNALVSNWDTANTTNKDILQVKRPDGAEEQWYVVQDLGASFGRFVGPQGTPIKWFPSSFQQDHLVQKSDGSVVHINYAAYGDPPTSVPVDHARWLVSLLNRLQEWQIRRALEAAGATPQEQQAYTAELLERIGELRSAVATPSQAR